MPRMWYLKVDENHAHLNQSTWCFGHSSHQWHIAIKGMWDCTKKAVIIALGLTMFFYSKG